METKEDLQLEISRLSTENAMLKTALEMIWKSSNPPPGDKPGWAKWRLDYVNGIAAEALGKPISEEEER